VLQDRLASSSSETRLTAILLALTLVILLWSNIGPKDRMTWFLEVAPVLQRNHYDRLGHLAQGFVPAILAREILLRTTPLMPGKMLFFIVTSICLAFSAFYEMIEWWAALLYGASAEAFLATQGDIWDTQWDMFIALIGAISAQLIFNNLHNRQLEALRLKTKD
jgi:putative membrane protein